MKLLKFAPLALAALVSMPALAVEKSILVYADVDPTLELLQSDGSALPPSMEMSYLPGAGLQPRLARNKVVSKVQFRASMLVSRHWPSSLRRRWRPNFSCSPG